MLVGTVRDASTGAPLSRVAVRLEGVGRTVLTDETGHYAFAHVPDGEQTLRVSMIGYTPATKIVILVPGAERVVNVALEPSPVRLRPVTVIHQRTRLVGEPGRLAEIPGAAHSLDRARVEDPKFLFDDVHTVLRQVPGVNIQEEEGYGLRPNIGLRGTGAERSSKITVMEDGVLIAPAPYAAPSAYYFPVVGRMEAIEVRKGSSQIKYGPRTVGGALNLVSTSIPETLTLAGEVEAGEDATRKLRAKVGDAYRNVGWLAEGYQIRTNGFKRLEGVDTGFDVEDYLVKLRLNANPTAPIYQELEIKLGYTDEVSHETYLGLTEEDFRQNALQRYAASQRDVMDAQHRQLQARYFIRPAPWLDLMTTVYRNDFARNWYKLQSVNGEGLADVLQRPGDFAEHLAVLRGADSDPDALVLRANNREYFARGVQSHVGLRVGGSVEYEVEMGVRYHEDQEDRFQHEDGFRMANGSMVLTSKGSPGSQSNRVSDARAWAFFVQHKLTVGRLSVAPGIRFEHVDFTRTDYAGDDPGRLTPTGVRENDVTAWVPGVGARYGVTAALSLFAGAHKGFGPPGPGAAPETAPEESVNYELGVRVRRTGLHAEVVGFVSDYENVLGRATLATGETGAGDQFNGGAVDVGGVEVAVEFDPLANRESGIALPMQLTYTFTRATFRTGFESEFEPWGTVEPGDRLPYVAEHQLYASAGIRRGRWAASFGASYTGAMRTVAGQGPIPAGGGTDAAVVMSLAGQAAITAESVVFVAVQNLADARHVVARRPAGTRPGLPRTLMAGVRLGR